MESTTPLPDVSGYTLEDASPVDITQFTLEEKHPSLSSLDINSYTLEAAPPKITKSFCLQTSPIESSFCLLSGIKTPISPPAYKQQTDGFEPDTPRAIAKARAATTAKTFSLRTRPTKSSGTKTKSRTELLNDLQNDVVDFTSSDNGFILSPTNVNLYSKKAEHQRDRLLHTRPANTNDDKINTIERAFIDTVSSSEFRTYLEYGKICCGAEVGNVLAPTIGLPSDYELPCFNFVYEEGGRCTKCKYRMNGVFSVYNREYNLGMHLISCGFPFILNSKMRYSSGVSIGRPDYHMWYDERSCVGEQNENEHRMGYPEKGELESLEERVEFGYNNGAKPGFTFINNCRNDMFQDELQVKLINALIREWKKGVDSKHPFVELPIIVYIDSRDAVLHPEHNMPGITVVTNPHLTLARKRYPDRVFSVHCRDQSKNRRATDLGTEIPDFVKLALAHVFPWCRDDEVQVAAAAGKEITPKEYFSSCPSNETCLAGRSKGEIWRLREERLMSLQNIAERQTVEKNQNQNLIVTEEKRLEQEMMRRNLNLIVAEEKRLEQEMMRQSTAEAMRLEQEKKRLEQYFARNFAINTQAIHQEARKEEKKKWKKRLALARERADFFSNPHQYTMHEVAVPEGTSPGSNFSVLIDGQSTIVTCPSDHQTGMKHSKVLVRLPKKPS